MWFRKKPKQKGRKAYIESIKMLLDIIESDNNLMREMADTMTEIALCDDPVNRIELANKAIGMQINHIKENSKLLKEGLE